MSGAITEVGEAPRGNGLRKQVMERRKGPGSLGARKPMVGAGSGKGRARLGARRESALVDVFNDI